MKKKLTTLLQSKQLKMMVATGILLVTANELFAQEFNLDALDANAKKGGSTLLMIGKMGLTLVGLVGAGVSGFNVFAKGQNSWQYIGAFVVCLIILAVGLTMFGTLPN